MITLRVPPTFFDDHVDRCGLEPESRIVRKTKDHWVVELVAADVADLYSDAVHYHESGVQAYGRESLGLVSSARACRNGLVKQLGEQLLNDIIGVARAAAKVAEAAEKARNEADPVWCAARDARLAAEAERKAAQDLLNHTNPLVDFRYLKTGSQLTLNTGRRWEVVGNDYAELLIRPVGTDWARADCRRLQKPIKNDRINDYARVLEIPCVVEYHHPE